MVKEDHSSIWHDRQMFNFDMLACSSVHI